MMMTSTLLRRSMAGLVAAAVLLAAAGCSKPVTEDALSDTVVYSGGDILTMAGRDAAYAEALAVRDGKILAVGTRDEVAKAAGAEATQVDLAGKTLLPGFIDGHSHLLNYADSLVQANLNPPPIGGVTSPGLFFMMDRSTHRGASSAPMTRFLAHCPGLDRRGFHRRAAPGGSAAREAMETGLQRRIRGPDDRSGEVEVCEPRRLGAERHQDGTDARQQLPRRAGAFRQRAQP
jgi:hypothetical protein